MSKSTTKIAFALLLALILIIGIYTSVQGAFAGGTRSGQTHVAASLKPDLAHVRSAPVQEVQSVMPQADSNFKSGGHDCHSESRVDPND